MKNLDQLLAAHAAPVLAGLKTANLVACPRTGAEDLAERVRPYATALAPRGVRFRVLCACERRALLLVYRPAQLLDDLAQPEARQMLRRAGYPMVQGLDALLDHLALRIRWESDFPHEIGLFLGYPVEDVRGFQEQGGRDCKLTGYWKVYGDAQAARRLFRRFDRCRSYACACVANGMTIVELFAG